MPSALPSRAKLKPFADALRGGAEVKAAAESAGLSKSTSARWKKLIEELHPDMLADAAPAPGLALTDGLAAFCEDEFEKALLLACLDAGGCTGAAQIAGHDERAVYKKMKALKARAALRGYAPEVDMTRPTAAPFHVRGTSTLYDGDGAIRAQWVKTKLDPASVAKAMHEGARAFVEALPQLPAPPGPVDYSTDIIPWIQIGDAHLGMVAYAMETGENFDLKIAEAELCGAVEMLLNDLPCTERLVINDLGDFTHYDNFAGVTSASGHALDCDTRFPKMVRVYSRVMRYIVDLALKKARHVDVIINQGNHSRVNDFWMREMLSACYGHTGRVHVLDNDSVFIAYRMGKTLVMVHHSDKCRPKDLMGVMTTDFKADFGETDFHYIDIGHVHHHFVSKEHPGIVVESWNHLASSDKWAHESGYRSRKSISVVLRSKTYGEIGRRLLPIEQVRDHLSGSKISTPARRAFSV